jgi:murein DD-endopeptidase MepM/ murein hydrolase activator NlpD
MLRDTFFFGRPARHWGRKAIAAAAAVVVVWSSTASSPAPSTALAAADSAIARLENRELSLDKRIRAHRRTVSGLRRQAQRLGARKQTVQKQVHRARKNARREGSTTISRDRNRNPEDARRLALHVRRTQIARQRSAVVARLNRQHRVIATLNRARKRLEDQLWRIRPLGECPVRGPISIADDFGAARYLHGEYDHAHQGNDIMAPHGAPIVAPFDGRAAVASNKLGGMSVKVFGAAGYVYNAHLSALGKLGEVQAGDVVGYVGTTGNAQGSSPHDHFEWHPNGGSAVDPHALLLQVC